MWYRLYDGPDEAVGPLVFPSMLRGRAQQIAMNLRLADPTGHVDVGDAAFVKLSVEEVRDPMSGQVIQQMIPSGVQSLLNELRSAFGEAEQLQATKALETFFEFRRGRLSLQAWSVQWQKNLEEAITHAGLEINPVARTYLYLKSSGLSTKAVDDLLLQVHCDMRRFEEIRTLLLRMANRSLDGHGNNPTLHYEEHKMDDDASSWSMVSDYTGWRILGMIPTTMKRWIHFRYGTKMDGMKAIGMEITVMKKDGKTKPGMSQAGMIYLLEKKKAMVLKELGKMRRTLSTTRARTKEKEAWDLVVLRVVRSGITHTLVPWVMLPGNPREAEFGKSSKGKKGFGKYMAKEKEKVMVREKARAMVTGRAMASEAIGWTMRTT